MRKYGEERGGEGEKAEREEREINFFPKLGSGMLPFGSGQI